LRLRFRDIRLSIWEETVQITVHQGGRFIEGYEVEIASIPTECKAWINLLERL
jgi:hypothetical protein